MSGYGLIGSTITTPVGGPAGGGGTTAAGSLLTTPADNTAGVGGGATGGSGANGAPGGSGASVYSWGAMYTRATGALPSADRPARTGGVGGRLFGVGNTPGSLW